MQTFNTFECFIEKDGQFLMLRRNPDRKIMPDVWMAPGGKRKCAEGLYTAVRREVKEETGLEIKNIQIKVTGAAYIADTDSQFFFHLLRADYDSGSVIECNEGRLQWLKPDEIKTLPNLLAELTPEIIDHIVSKENAILSYFATYDQGNHLTAFTLEKP